MKGKYDPPFSIFKTILQEVRQDFEEAVTSTRVPSPLQQLREDRL